MSRPFGPYEQFIVIYILLLFLYTLERAADERVHMPPLQVSGRVFTFTPGYARGYTSYWPFRPPENVGARMG